jgi:hypothetical protein
MQSPAYNHPAFHEVAKGLSEIVHATETKYANAADNGGLVLRNILEALAAFISLYAAERLCPPEAADAVGDRLNDGIARCLEEILRPTNLLADFDQCPWPTSPKGTA